MRYGYGYGYGPLGGKRSVPPFNTLISSVTVLQSVQSDLGITLNGSAVSAWADQSGNGKNYSQGTGSAQPLFVSNQLNGYPVVRFDGSNDNLNSSLVLPAPGTTPTWIWFVAKTRVDPASGARFLAPNVASNVCLVLTGGSSPNFQVSQFNTTGVNPASPMLTGSWYRFEIYFTNSTNDYVKLGPTTTTGANAGNSSTATGRAMGKQPSEPGALAFDIVALLYCNNKPNASEIAALSSAVTAKYGTAVSV